MTTHPAHDALLALVDALLGSFPYPTTESFARAVDAYRAADPTGSIIREALADGLALRELQDNRWWHVYRSGDKWMVANGPDEGSGPTFADAARAALSNRGPRDA